MHEPAHAYSVLLSLACEVVNAYEGRVSCGHHSLLPRRIIVAKMADPSAISALPFTRAFVAYKTTSSLSWYPFGSTGRRRRYYEGPSTNKFRDPDSFSPVSTLHLLHLKDPTILDAALPYQNCRLLHLPDSSNKVLPLD